MNFYGIRELSSNTKTVLGSVSGNGTAVITDNGKPAALLIGITEKNFEAAYDMARRYRAQQAFAELQAQAQETFPNGLPMEEIDEMIAEARKGE